jgi:hypothetical protein
MKHLQRSSRGDERVSRELRPALNRRVNALLALKAAPAALYIARKTTSALRLRRKPTFDKVRFLSPFAAPSIGYSAFDLHLTKAHFPPPVCRLYVVRTSS